MTGISVGRRGLAIASVYHVELVNIGTLESNSPVMIDGVVVGSVGKMTLRGWIVDLALMSSQTSGGRSATRPKAPVAHAVSTSFSTSRCP